MEHHDAMLYCEAIKSSPDAFTAVRAKLEEPAAHGSAVWHL
jgi:hypothetical protein